MPSIVTEYFAMLGRETAIPRWMGGHPRNETLPSPAESLDGEYGGNHKDGVQDTTVVDYTGEQSDSSVLATQKLGSLEGEREYDTSVGIGKYWSVIATGAGLFSDGYLNNSVGIVTTCLSTLYPDAYAQSNAMSNVSSITFVGTVVGMWGFGFLSDHVGRKAGMLSCTFILIVFSILSAGSWGVGMPTHPGGMFAMLTTCRALLGVGIGGEYPTGSVAAAEACQALTNGSRNRWFVLFTNFMIDFGYVVSAFVGWILLYICSVPATTGTHGLGTVWRVLLGLGAVAPFSLLYLRLKFKESKQFVKNSLRSGKQPYWFIIKRYAPRFIIVSLIWFIYDFLSYSWGIYSSTILKSVVPDGNIKTTFGWNVLFNVFYIPGSFLGAFSADYFGPRLTLAVGTMCQAIMGFAMAGRYKQLQESIAGFVVVFGVFMSFGEFGPGDNIGLICSKTAPSALRGRYYGLAAGIGKIGAFVGTKVFPSIAKHYGGIDSNEGQMVLFWVSSALCALAAVLSMFIPELSQETVAEEDVKFRIALEEAGYDTAMLGN